IGMLIVVTMLGAGAMNMAKKPTPLNGASRARAKAEKVKYEGDLASLPTRQEQPEAIQGVVLGDLDRKGDAQDAAAAAAADAAAKADGKAEAKADEAGKAAAAAQSASATPAMAAGDLTAKAGKLPGGKQGFEKKFGALSTNLPG